MYLVLERERERERERGRERGRERERESVSVDTFPLIEYNDFGKIKKQRK
jgi:hypothetical protein